MRNLLIIIKKAKVSRWILITFLAFVYTIGISIFVSPLGLFPAGIGAISAFITYSVDSLGAYFSIFYLILNLPLLLFSYFRNNFYFTLKTGAFIVAQAIFSLIDIFAPFINTVVRSIYNVSSIDQIIDKEYIILIFSFVSGAVFGAIIATVWKAGGSVGGSDIISNYLAKKKSSSLGLQLFYLAISFTIISFVIFIGIDEVYRENWFIYLVATIFYVLVSIFVQNLVFPKYGKVQLEIHTTKVKEVSKRLRNSHFPHSFLLHKAVSGYTKNERDYISTIALLLEVKKIIKVVKSADENAWISINKISAIRGNFNTEYVDSGHHDWLSK